MKYVIKFFPEITIKSRPVRQRLAARLCDNINRVFRAEGISAQVNKQWDKLVVVLADAADAPAASDILSRISGIASFLDVAEFELTDVDAIFRQTLDLWGARLAGKCFVVRCKRVGDHSFSSQDVEQYVGGGLLEHSDAAGVDLRNADITVSIEIRDEQVFIVNERHKGLGGFPVGGIEPVLSLISGGFDSTVASFQSMRRGMPTHFCFFNLGGREHERGVKEMAWFLWSRYGSAQPVKFVTIPFDGVVASILENVSNSQMGVVLKRQMFRAAAAVADKAGLHAIVTGESVAQVASQTLVNLSVIDCAIDTLVLRPLAMMDKDDIIGVARDIGAESLCAQMPEYCGVISVKPTTKARLDRIEDEESRLDPQVFADALAAATVEGIDNLTLSEMSAAPETLSVPVVGATLLDVRHPDEVERRPLNLPGVEVVKLPFYQLHSKSADLDKSRSYMLYCDKGVMSRMHAAQMMEEGFQNIRVYRPAPPG